VDHVIIDYYRICFKIVTDNLKEVLLLVVRRAIISCYKGARRERIYLRFFIKSFAAFVRRNQIEK
jgi:hypothetical protein